jgi:EAL domain-containing protein (putative c-di-GMP-specific phosphodiesterase class I)
MPEAGRPAGVGLVAVNLSPIQFRSRRLGASLSMVTTAEGVETQEQFDRLRQEGCTEVQGFLVSQPCDA